MASYFEDLFIYYSLTLYIKLFILLEKKYVAFFFCRYITGLHYTHIQLLQKHQQTPHGTGGTGSPYCRNHPDTR